MDIVISDERMEEKMEKELTRPELPILNIGMPADSEGRTSFSPGWMNGNIEDILRKVFPLTGRMMGIRIAFVSMYTIDQIAKIRRSENNVNIEYIPPQERMGEEIIVSIDSEEVEKFVGLLKPDTVYEVSRTSLSFPEISIKI